MTTTIDVYDFVAPDGDVVQSGLMAAAAVENALSSSEIVCVDCRRLKGASSSYFNALLNSVAQKYGKDALEKRLQFNISSTVIRGVFQRSLEAALRPAVS